ncbi:MAG: YerC/YecD family TrpR-related protein [Oscillospiraceae bacterium]|nr:YerC/YecD family TrpR-related protein [Oscillospiraceae bacterium]
MSLPQTQETDQLFRSILALQSVEECYQYFEDLCTVREIQSISQRLAVAEMLAGGRSYQQTIQETGASSATISRVKRCLEYGAGGYQLVLERLTAGKEDSQ